MKFENHCQRAVCHLPENAEEGLKKELVGKEEQFRLLSHTEGGGADGVEGGGGMYISCLCLR